MASSHVTLISAGGVNNRRIASSIYGYCTTAAETAVKTVSLYTGNSTTADGTWAAADLFHGLTISIRFQYANSVANPTLNVNGTGAKPIYRYGTTAPSTNAATSWMAQAVVDFTYDTLLNTSGCWVMHSTWDNDTTYSSKTAVDGGSQVSLVTTGQKYTWNQKTSNTGTVTKVTAGAGLKVGTNTSGGDITTSDTIAHINSITAGTVGTSSATSGSTLDIPYITFDTEGHITASGTHTHTISLPSNTYVTFTGTETISGAKTFSAVTSFTNTTQSSSLTTGAVKISGGLGVAKTIYSDLVMSNALRAGANSSGNYGINSSGMIYGNTIYPGSTYGTAGTYYFNSSGNINANKISGSEYVYPDGDYIAHTVTGTDSINYHIIGNNEEVLRFATKTRSASDQGVSFILGNGYTAGGSAGTPTINNLNTYLTGGRDAVSVYLCSYPIYNRTYTYTANVHITENGILGRITSSSIRYKHDVEYFTNEEYSIVKEDKKIKNNNLLKKEEIENPEDILNIPIVNFKYNEGYVSGEENFNYDKPIMGFIADDIAKICPDCATYIKDQNGERIPESWDVNKLVVRMLYVLQKQQKEIQELKGEISE